MFRATLAGRVAALALLAAAATFAPAATPAVAASLAGAAGEPQSPRWLMERGRWNEAAARLEAAQKSHPDDPQVLSALAEVRARFGRLEEAQKLAERAVELAPNDGGVRASLADVLGEMASEAGALKALGLAKRFRKEAEAAIALDPKQVGPRRGLMEFHLRAPGIAGGDKKKSPLYAAEIAGLDPVEGELAHARLAELSRDTLAIEGRLRKAVALAPGSAEARMALANWCSAPWRKRASEAEEHARAARAADPDRPGPVTLLAVLYAQQGRWADVDALLADAAKSFPAVRPAWYQAGRVALVQGSELARAERWFREYLEHEPEPGAPSRAHAHWRLAQVLEKQGRKSDAVGELQAALRLRPDLQEAKKDLKRLRG